MLRLSVIVLAAGHSSRFAASGEHKLLATVEGAPLVRLSVSAALDAAVGAVVVVTGAQSAAVTAALHDLPVRIVHARGFADGMATSLRSGIEAIAESADAALVALGDQPTVRPEAFRRVVAGWRSGAAIVVPRHLHATEQAHPVLFAAEVYGELLSLRGDVGARAVIAADPSRVASVDLDWPAPRDVDTTEDLDAVRADLDAAQHARRNDSRQHGAFPPALEPSHDH